MKTVWTVESDEAFDRERKASVVLGWLKTCFYPEMRDARKKLVANVFWLSGDAGLETTVCGTSEVVVMLRVYIFLCGQEMEIASGLAKMGLSYAPATSSDDDSTKARTSRRGTGPEMVYGRLEVWMGISEQASGPGYMQEHDVCWTAYQSDENARGYGWLHASASEGDRGVQKYCVYVDAWPGEGTLAGVCTSLRIFLRSNPENA